MKQTPCALLSLLVGACAAAAHAAPVFDYDPNQSVGFSHVFGDAMVQSVSFSPYDTFDSSIEANYVQPGGVHDWGNEAVGGGAAGAIASSADAFISFDGDGTNEIRVRFSSDALLDSSPPSQPNGYDGRADSQNDYSLTTVMNGLIPGQSYAINYSWSIIAAAGFPASHFGSSTAEGSLTAFGALGPLFADSVVGVDGQPPVQSTPSGSGVFLFLATAGSANFQVSATSRSAAEFFGPADFDDLVGATFYAEATFTLVPVPEPSTLVASAAALMLLGRRRRLRGCPEA